MSVNVGSAVAYLDLDVSKFQSGLSKVGKDFKQFTDSTESAGTRITALGEGLKSVGSSMTKNVSLPLAAIGTASVATAANFEKSMSQVAATMGITAEEINNGSESFEKLEKAAKEMGATTQFSASESAEALNYLALAGYDVDTAISVLPKTLNLAAAGGMDLASAADMVTDGLSALGMGAEDADRFVDVLAKTSQKSNTSVSQLGEALLTVGGTAQNLSGGLEEASTAIGILSDNGIKGAESGTALRNIILSLTPTTDKAVAAFERLGVETYDANGNLKPLNETFGELDAALSTLSQEEKTRALSDIFNKTDLKSVNALLANSGERFDELSGYINESKGAAEDMAETMNNNLSGQLTLLKSGLEGAAIAIGEALLPYIKQLVDWIGSMVEWFNNLDPSIQTTIATVGLLVAGIGPLLMIIGSVVTILPVLGAGFVALGGPIGLVIAGIVLLISTIVYLCKNWEQMKADAERVWNSLVENFNIWMDIIKVNIENTWNNLKAFLENTWNNIKTSCESIWNNIKTFFETVSNTIKSFIEACWNGIKGFLDAIWNGIKSIAETVWNAITKLIDTQVKATQQVVETVWNAIKTAIDLVWKGIQTIVDTGTKLVKSTIEAVWNTLEAILIAPFEAAKSVIDGILGGISSAINGVVDFVGGIFGKSVDVEANVNGLDREALAMAYDVSNSSSMAENSSIVESVSSISRGLNLKKNNDNDVKSNGMKNIVINNTYNSPKAASIRELKKQDEIQMQRLAMQF